MLRATAVLVVALAIGCQAPASAPPPAAAPPPATAAPASAGSPASATSPVAAASPAAAPSPAAASPAAASPAAASPVAASPAAASPAAASPAAGSPAAAPPPAVASPAAGSPTAGSPAPSAPAAVAPPPQGAARVDVLNAADAAFARGDLTNASGLYERVLNTPPSGESPAATSAINSYAQFRDMVTLLADGREDDARAQLDALQQADASAPFARLASQLWDQYGMVGSLRGACAQLQPQVASQAGSTLSALQALGVSVDPQTLCSPPTAAG